MVRGQQQVRQRKKSSSRKSLTNNPQSSSSSAAAAAAKTSPPSTDGAPKSKLGRLIAFLTPIVRVLCPPMIGILSAAALTSENWAVGYFIITVLSMFTIIFLTFLSILKKHDNTMLVYPTVHRADGTKVTDDPVSFFEYDKKVATYYASELPAFAVAACWFYLWTGYRLTFLIYSAYLSYRTITDPIFRIHIWNEKAINELERPFGFVPLFKKETTSVKIIEGLSQFDSSIQNAPADSLVVLDCSATWCAPCKAMAPVFENFAKEFGSCSFLTVDIDVSEDVAKKLEITSVPTFVFFKGGKQIEVLRGATPQQLRTAIQENL